ncbi:MAG: hypothetical protein KDE33_10180, partial [Bacteroidetes bacterium]|nr:hypothetical protein [Bacteroidota bacterium]
VDTAAHGHQNLAVLTHRHKNTKKGKGKFRWIEAGRLPAGRASAVSFLISRIFVAIPDAKADIHSYISSRVYLIT